MSKECISTAKAFEKSIWLDAVPSSKYGPNIFELSLEDHILYLCLHMAAHFIDAGFGLRQLCDFLLLMEANESKIDWLLLYRKLKICKIENFFEAIFVVCHRLFGLQDAKDICSRLKKNEPYIDLLIEDIFSGGVYGSRTQDRRLSNLQLHYAGSQRARCSPKRYVNFLCFLFPPVKELREKYDYARRNPFLAPIAWLHRIIHGAFRKDFLLSEKFSFLFPKASSGALDSRIRLLEWLDLP